MRVPEQRWALHKILSRHGFEPQLAIMSKRKTAETKKHTRKGPPLCTHWGFEKSTKYRREKQDSEALKSIKCPPTQTHTHAHINMYIYIYMRLLDSSFD